MVVWRGLVVVVRSWLVTFDAEGCYTLIDGVEGIFYGGLV